MPFLVRHRATAGLVLAALLPLTLHGQCEPQWQSTAPVSSPRGNVMATTVWDPDGPGPATTVLVAAGRFAIDTAKGVAVATYDGAHWTPIGTSTLGSVTAMVVYSGQLVVAGGGRIHIRSGGGWQLIGRYTVPINTASVQAMVVFGGDLFVAGRFTAVDGAPANNIARWNGTAWSPLGAGLSTGQIDSVEALASFTYNSAPALWVGGRFTSAGGIAASHLALWNGSTWLAPARTDAPVRAMAARFSTTPTTSYLFVGGEFTSIGGITVDRVARLTAASGVFSAMGTLPGPEPCRALFVRAAGASSYELLAAQESQALRWGGAAWNTLGPSLRVAQGHTGPGNILWPSIESFSLYGGRYVVGLSDYFGLLGGAWNYDGTNWHTVDGLGIDDRVHALLPIEPEPDLVIGGRFRSISGVPMHGVARRVGSTWQALGTGVTGGDGTVLAVARLPNGDLIAGGQFSVAAGAVSDNIARFDGTTWHPLGGGTNGAVLALLVMPNGDLIAGGSFSLAGSTTAQGIARWNGSYWSDLDGGVAGGVRALAQLPAGDIVAGGSFLTAGRAAMPTNRVARWNGTAWRPLGAGVDDLVHGVAGLPDGDVVICGAFDNAGGVPANGIARWNGSVWQPMPAGLQGSRAYRAIVALPNGDIVVGGERFSAPWPVGGTTGESVARLRGSTWEALRVGYDVFSDTPDIVHALAMTAGGDLFVGGYFHVAGNLVSGNLARLAATCPATVVPYGAGCAGAGGVDTLTAATRPWIGAAFRARGSGLPASSLALSLYGIQAQSLPISSVLPQGLPGCVISTTIELSEALVPVAGGTDTRILLPPSLSLAGLVLHHQLIGLELGAGGRVTGITSSNGLRMTIGAL
jgi:hypothetical protein